MPELELADRKGHSGHIQDPWPLLKSLLSHKPLEPREGEPKGNPTTPVRDYKGLFGPIRRHWSG